MMQRECLEVNNNFQLNNFLMDLKNSLYNPAIAQEADELAAALDNTREPFDALKYEEHLKQYPSLTYLHLVAPSDE